MPRPKLNFDPDGLSAMNDIHYNRVILSSDGGEWSFTMQAPHGQVDLNLSDLPKLISWMKGAEAYYHKEGIDEELMRFLKREYDSVLIYNNEEVAVMHDFNYDKLELYSNDQNWSFILEGTDGRVELSLDELSNLINYTEGMQAYYYPPGG